MTDQVQNEVTENRKVAMSDGAIIDFGKRNNVVQSNDLEAGQIVFRVFTGETIVADLTKVEDLHYADLPELAKQYALYAATNKIKVGIASVKLTEVTVGEDGELVSVNTLAKAIQESVDSIEKGEFSTRSSGGDAEEGLDDVIKYFAVAAGSFPKYVYANEAFAPAVKREGDFLIFNEEVDASVILEITKTWDALSTKEKNAAKRDQHFKLVEGDAIKHKLSTLV